MRRMGAGLLMIGALSGCASLAIRPADSLFERAGKLGVRLPLSVLTLSASEFRIQSVESGRAFRTEVAARRRAIDAARARAREAETYPEAREWTELADALASELERRIAEREADFGDARRLVGAGDDAAASPGCRTRVEGSTIETDCR